MDTSYKLLTNHEEARNYLTRYSLLLHRKEKENIGRSNPRKHGVCVYV